MADTLKNGFTYTDASQESKFINIILDGNNVQTGENSNLNQTLEKNESKQEKTQEKTISCLTALSIDKIGSNNGMEPAYFQDILYYKNYIFYILNDQDGSDYIQIIDCSNSQEIFIYNDSNGTKYYQPANTLKKLYITDDEEAYYLYIGSIDNLLIKLIKIKIPKNSGTDSIYLTQRYTGSGYIDCSDAIIQTLYQYTLDTNYTFNGFYINADETRGFVSLTDSTGNYLLTMPLSTTSAYEEPSGLIVSPNSQVHVKLDRFKTDQFYSIYGNQALSMTGGASYNTALKTIALPYTIDDAVGHVDYFGDFIVYTENGITFYITNTNTSETKILICEDDLLSLDSDDITTLRVKKYTLAGELQFYIGTSQGRHIKFYSDTESFVRINYDFISPYAKSILKIEADPYKNTENILICYNTARNQARILNENIKITGASTLAAQYDTIANLETEINTINSDVQSNSRSISVVQSNTSNLERYVKQGTLISIDQLNTIKNSGLYTITVGNDESILPIARVPNENIVIQHISSWGNDGYDYAITQIIHYTSQRRSFIRYREKMTEQSSSSNSQYWSEWSEILVTNNTDNFLENRLLITGDNKQIENCDINPKDIITQKNSNLISDELDTITTDAEDIFINGGSFYDSRSISGTNWPSVSGDLSSCTLSSNSILTDSNLYLFSKSAVDTGTITLPGAIQNDFTSYDQTSPFKFHFGFILDYDSSGASQIEVLRVFNSFVMHMNSNSSVRIVATTRSTGTSLKVSDWLSSTGLCAIAIDGSNNGEITLAVQPLYEDYTKKGALVSDTITLSSSDKIFYSSNINNVINLRANMNLSCFFVETGTSISDLTASELIDKMLEMRTLKKSPIATQDYVDAKTVGIPYCTCSTSSSTSAKIVNNVPDSFVLEQGARILVNFTNSNIIASPTLNVNGTGAKSIKVYGSTAPLTYAWHAGAFIEFVYDGTYWILMNREPASTTYAGIVKLSTSTSSTSTTTAATSSAVKALKDQLDGMANLTLSTDLSYEEIS